MKKFLKRLLILVICFVMIMSNISLQGKATFAAEDGASSALAQDIIDYADLLFGDNGENPDNPLGGPLIRVGVTSPSGSDFYAGQTVKYVINYVFKAVPNWSEGYDLARTLFDSYEDNRIAFRLPEGLLLAKVPAAYEKDMVIVENPDHSHTYIFDLGERAAAASNSSFEIEVFITGNGTEDAIRTFNMQDAVEFTTIFTVLDKSVTPNAELRRYLQAVSASASNLTTKSPDVWGVTKEVVGTPAVNRADMTVTVNYLIKVGLMDGSNMITAASQYNRLGRDAVDSMTLKDSDLLAVIRNNQLLDGKSPELLSATIKKTGASDSDAVTLPSTESIDLTEGAFALNTVTVADRVCTIGSDGKGTVSQTTNVVPAYTDYQVSATYKITENMIQHFENADDRIDFSNRAELVYTLANMQQKTDQSSANTSANLPTMVPASLEIKKFFKDYHGTVGNYTQELENKFGKIRYTIKSANGATFKVYGASGNPLTGDLTQWDQAETGKTYYLTPGIPYVVEEYFNNSQMEQDPSGCANLSKTPSEGEAWTATFQNREKAADVEIVKVDSSALHNPVPGAKFTISGGPGVNRTETTGTDGKLVFDRLPYGTYHIVESQTPAGFSGRFETDITISGNEKITVNAENDRNSASVSVTKYVATRANDYQKAGSSFPGTFKLQRKTANGSWQDVTTDISGAQISTTLDRNGQITASVAPFDSNNNVYTYRFVENIPTSDGYYDPANPSATVAYSSEVTLVDATGKALAQTVNVDMYNGRNVTVTVNKEFWDASSNGKLVKNTTKNVQVTLYRQDGQNFTKVGDSKSAGTEAAVWENLPAFDSNGEIKYYVTEADVSGYALDKAATSNSIITKDGVDYIPVTTGSTSANKLINVEQAIPVVVKKQNYYTEAFVNGTGFSITVDGATAKDARNGNDITDTLITTSAGTVVYLQAGKSYVIKETYNTSGLKDVTGEITVDLTNVNYSTYAGRDTANLKTVTIKNAPNPQLKVTKKTTETGNNISGAVYTLYRKLDDGTFEAVKNAQGNNVTVNANNQNSGVRVEPGVYYFAETTVPSGYINPNTVPDEYINKFTGMESGLTTDGKRYTFAKVTVTDAAKSGKTDNIYSKTFYNIPNKANLTVKKLVDGKTATVAGFPVTVKKLVNGVETAVTSGTTDGSGSVTFSNLPIYDNTTGEKIQYIIDEGELDDDQKELYYKVSTPQTAVLSVGTGGTNRTTVATVSKATDGKNLEVKNETLTSVEVSKYYTHFWESQYTQMYYPMSGVEIGLYVLEGDTYKLVSTEVTTGATASFGGLRRDAAYAVVEISSPDEYLEPFQDGVYKEFAVDEQGNALDEIKGADLSKYNARTLAADTADNKRENNTVLERLLNSDHWVQFDITKYLDKDILGKDIQEHGTAVEPTEDSKYDNAVFELYRMEVPEGVTSVEFNTDSDNNWELMGTYISGTAYDLAGNRRAGELVSNVDSEANDKVVYLLVERNAGPNGAMINPNFKYTFWKNVDAEYTVTLTGSDSGMNSLVRPKNYILNAVNTDMLLNSRSDEGEGESTLVSSIRIAKWADSFDGEGLPKGEFTPLPNATFTVYLDRGGEIELESMTVGLDNTDKDHVKAWAQGTAYSLTIDDGRYSTKGVLTDYAKENGNGEPFATEVDIVNVAAADDHIIFGVPVYIKETSAPKGYSYEPGMMDMYLCFVYYLGTSGVSEVTVYNDAYFVTTAEENCPLVSTQTGYAAVASWMVDETEMNYGSPMYRIVDYPMEDTLVRINKYGYIPTEATKGLTSDELDSADVTEKTPLAGIEMLLQAYDEESKSWKNYNYREKVFTNDESAAKFTTDLNGSYLFAAGLPEGRYHVIETDLKSYSTTYENAYKDASFAREFTVGAEALTVSMYNPKMTELTLIKKDTSGNTVENVSFSLKGAENLTVSTDSNGTAKFSAVKSGNYRLEEAVVNGTKLSTAYISVYATGVLKTLVDGNTLVGYELENNGTDTVVKTIGVTDATGALEVVNPKLVSFSIKKVDEEDADELLSGAEFQIYSKKFSTWDGTMAVETPDDNWTGWNKGATVTTDGNGIASVTDYMPGIYAFYETKAPEGYDIILDENGNPIIHYLVLTGGMNVTVTGIDAVISDTTAEVTVENRPKVTLNATKVVEQGKIEDELKWNVTLALYDGESRIGEAKISDASDDAVTFAAGEKVALLSQGKTYYIVEEDVPGYKLKGVKVNGDTVQAVNGRYPVTVTGADTVSVEVTNTYMHGYVKFSKVDSEDLNELLPGAGFKVFANVDGVLTETGTVTEILKDGKGTGVYEADVILVSEEKTTYYIVETSAPDNYVLADGIQLEVELSAEENVPENNGDAYLTNVKGWNLDIQKYASAYDAENPVKAGANDASFTLFHFNKEKDAWEIEKEAVVTDAEGKVSFLLTPFEDYAFYEDAVKNGKFIGLDKWALDGKDDEGNDTKTVVDARDLKEISVGTTKYKVIVLNNVNESFTYSAYNIPALSVKIVKRDAGGFPENIIPTADFSVYELAEALPTENAAALDVISELLESGEPVFTGVTDQVEGNTTYKLWNECDPTKNYVIVETLVGSTSQAEYDTLNKDDSRVVWYVGINADADADASETHTYYLDNVYGTADVLLEKDVVDSTVSEEGVKNDVTDKKVESLLAGSRNVIYTITPNFTKDGKDLSRNQALSSFTVEDTGLTFDIDDAPDYTIDSIVIGKATQNTENLVSSVDLTDAKVSATVTWVDKNGEEKSTTVNDLAEDTTVATAGAVSFKVEYFSKKVQDGTEKYSLAADFKADPITVNVTVKKQEDGTVENPVTPVKNFKNSATLEMKYPKWKADGSGTEDVTVTRNADVTVDVKPLPYAVVKIEKSSNPGDSVEVGSDIEYVLKVTNEGNAPFVNPVIVDLLPTGVTYTGNYSVGIGDKWEVFTVTDTRVTGRPTLFYSTAEGAIAEGDAENAVMFSLKGELEPGSSVTLTFFAEVGSSTVIYGDTVYNPVFLSSEEHTYHTVDNPHGYSFRNRDGSFPGTLKPEAEHLSETAGKRLTGLDNELGKYADSVSADYIWVDAESEVKLIMKSSITLIKAIQGDQDTGFSAADDFLATSTRTNSLEEREGFVNYRLVVSNGTETDKYYLVLGDVLPGVGDGIYSYWDVVMDEINSIVFAGEVVEKDKDYFVYYYTGSTESANGAVIDAVNNANKWASDEAWPQGLVTIPENWHSDSETDFEKEDITAFLVVFNHDLVLKSGKSYIITYHTLVEDITDDEEFAHVAFENCVNQFYTNWEGSLEYMLSNQVSAVIMDGRVTVGGDVWIDEDMDGKQETTGNRPGRNDYKDYEIIKKLASGITFSISDERKYVSGVRYDDLGGVNEAAQISESIKHFGFDKLGSATQIRTPLYMEDTEHPGMMMLDSSKLKTSDPYNYVLRAEIADKSLLDIFTLTTLGIGHYVSDDPDEFPKAAGDSLEGADTFFDSNFYEVEEGVYVTQPFYIRYSATEDISKDIGFTMTRGLELSKVNEAGEPIEGAKFEISGPFDEGEASENGTALKFSLSDGVYVPDEEGETVLLTDENGKIKIDGLNWWKEYVLTETEAVEGYSLARATAAADATSAGTKIVPLTDEEGEDIEAKWVLQIPGTAKVEKFDKITVTNVEPTPVDLIIPVSKEIIGNATPADNDKLFRFVLKVKSNEPEAEPEEPAEPADPENPVDPEDPANPVVPVVPEEPLMPLAVLEPDDAADTPMPEKDYVEIIGRGTAEFGKITFTKVGEYDYELAEVDTEETGYTYDVRVRSIHVVVTDNHGDLEVSWTVNGEEVESVVFTNEYTPYPTEAVIEATKILKHKKLEADMFEFMLLDQDLIVIERVTNDDDGHIEFTPIEYTETGVYTYYVAEVEGDMRSIEYDRTIFEVTVVVTDVDGELQADVQYPEPVEFINVRIPDTGDGTNIMVYYALMAVALLGILLCLRRKEER